MPARDRRDRRDAPPIDLKLLKLFDELYRTRSVSRAADALGQSQPTVSIWLGRLRETLRDPLFVRTRGGMQPTPRADELIDRVRTALEAVNDLVGGEPAFDPATARRSFRICMTDASHITILPALLAHTRSAAPGITLEAENIGDDTPAHLESGRADLAIGFVPDLEAGFYQQTLYAQDFVCLFSAKHPRVGETLTLREYRVEPHVSILSRTGYSVIDAAMRAQKVEREVRLELPGFLGLATILSSSDLIATVPRTIGETIARIGALSIVPCPVRIAPFLVKQHWHARYHNDPGNRWLRSVCGTLFADTARGSPGAKAAGARASRRAS
ncbi:MAG: LysR family transcriptional regulator [Burkholderiales bacterium]|nr:LysR family transcriptional regulator [Burkholderiales bacterium]